MTIWQQCVIGGYIGKVLETDNSDAKISFYEHAETLSIGSIFCEPTKKD